MSSSLPSPESSPESSRLCSRIACAEPGAATLTFDYAEAVVVLGPLAPTRDPHSFDLCARHAGRTSAPQGWQLVRHQTLGGTAR